MSLSVKEFYGELLCKFVPRKCWLMCLLRNIKSYVNGTAYCSLNAILAELKKVPFEVYTMIELKNVSSIRGLYYD